MAAGASYEGLAADYDWLVPDGLRDGQIVLSQFAAAFDDLPRDAPLLDCACGTGWNVIALTAAGFHIMGTDGSPEMIDAARANAEAAGIAAEFDVMKWAELPRRMARQFSGVLCVGNSIVHANGAGGMASALAAMRSVLHPGGWLMLDSRDWEADRKPGCTVDVPSAFVRRGDVRCLPIRVWETPTDPSSPHSVEFVLVFDSQDGGVTTRRHRLSYKPFGLSELSDALAEAGFRSITSATDNSWLTVTARA